MKNPTSEVGIGLVGKYVEYEDSYKSLKEALLHGGHRAPGARSISTGSNPRSLNGRNAGRYLQRFDGILVPGGFGKRGIEGMMQRDSLRARRQDSLFRHLPRHADHGDRVSPATFADWRMRTPPNSIRPRRIA